MAKFHERLRELRTAKDISQSEFGKIIKVSKSSVNMYERGEREPGLETLEHIADYFNVDMDYLVGRSDIPNRIQLALSLAPKAVNADPDFSLDVAEKQLITKFRRLDDRGKAAVLNVLNHEFESLPGENAYSPAKEA